MGVYVLVFAPCSVRSVQSPLQSLSARPAPKLRIFSTQKNPLPLSTSLPLSRPLLLLNYRNGLLQAAQQPLLKVAPSLSPTFLPNTPPQHKGHSGIKSVPQQWTRGGIILSSATFNSTTQPVFDPRQTYIVMVAIHNACQRGSFVVSVKRKVFPLKIRIPRGMRHAKYTNVEVRTLKLTEKFPIVSSNMFCF